MPIHTHPFIGPLSRTTQVSRYQKVKPIWILQKQQTVSGSGISWAICKSAPRSRHTTTPAPHHSVFLQAGCPSCRPTNSVKALKAGIPIHTCKSSTHTHTLQADNHASTPPLSFIQAGCPSCRQTNSIKALKANTKQDTIQ